MKQDPIFVTPRCPIRTTLELIGGKWKLLILKQLLSNGSLRPSELKQLIPDISEKMLIQELKNMTESQLINRKNFGEVPPKVEYSLSKKGENVESLITELVLFAKRYET